MDRDEINARVIAQFRAGGEIEGMHRERLALLSTIGARTGRRRTTPLMFHRDGDRFLLVASNLGAPRDPGWYVNLVAEPRVVLEVEDVRYEAHAEPATGGEYDRLWAMLTQAYPFFLDHEAASGRRIPVVIVTP